MITLCPCRNCLEDAATAFQWRNDPETIAASYVRSSKSWDSFWLEYSDCYFETAALEPVFVQSGGNPVGFIRFEKAELADCPQGKTVEVMINIAPECRGKGIGTQAVQLVCRYLKNNGFSMAVADIRAENKASLSVFKKAGFAIRNKRVEFIPKTKENCSIVRMCCLL